MFSFATFQTNITLDRWLPILNVHGQAHHIVPTCLYGLRISNKLYSGQIYMYEPDDPLWYRSKFQSNINLHRYVGKITEILGNIIHMLQNTEH